jgi:hypothetical protein
MEQRITGRAKTMRQLRYAWILPVLMLLSGCSTSRLGRSWVAPGTEGLSFKRIAVVALTGQEVYRMQAEDALVSEMTNALASHTLLPGLHALRDTAAVVEALRGAGCDALVTLQMKSGHIKTEPEATDTRPATMGQAVDDYWTDPSTQTPESFASGQSFAVEVHLFDLRNGTLVWNGLAVEQGARDAAELIRMVRMDVLKDLRQRGLIPER